MQTKQPKFRIYATLLDSFTGYLNSDAIWNNYWGWSENPPHTTEEFHELQFQELINRINRVPFDSEAADRGTAFNEIVDCLIENRVSPKMEVERVYSPDGNENKLVALKATYNNREFVFPLDICKEFASYYKGAIPQLYTEAILHTMYGDVLLYGYIDELMSQSVHDIKTTGSYSVGKFKDHWQHYVYPYCLNRSGNKINTFEYNILELKKGMPTGTFTETYQYDEKRDVPILREHVENLCSFLIDNKELITDKKIMNND